MPRKLHVNLEKGFTDRVQREALETLKYHPLYDHKRADLAPFMNKTEYGKVLDNRFYIDHILMNERGELTQHPYGIGSERLHELIQVCDERGWRFDISGASGYFPGRTFCITFERKPTPRAGEE